MNLLKSLLKNKTIVAIITIAVAIVIIEIIGNLIIANKVSNWSLTVDTRVVKSEKVALDILNYKQQKLLLSKNEIVKKIISLKNVTSNNLLNIIEESKYNNLVIAIFYQNKLLTWNKKYLNSIKLTDFKDFQYNETFFSNTELNTYLNVIDTTTSNGNKYNLLVSEIVEKKYNLTKEYFDKISLIDELSTKIGTECEIEYSIQNSDEKDGRKHSFDIRNNLNNVIGKVIFVKPQRQISITNFEGTKFIVQSLLGLFGYLLIGILLYSEIKKQSSRFLFFSISTLYLIVFRYLLIFLKLPKNIFQSQLLESKFYSSEFGNGIASSPLDLSITALVVLAFVFVAHKLVSDFYQLNKNSKFSLIRNIASGVFMLLLYLFVARGFGAIIRGIIFDSSFQYFLDASLTPTLPQFVMHINILLVGISFTIVSHIIIKFVLISVSKKNVQITLLLLSIIFITTEIFFTLAQAHPQSTLLIKIFQIISIFILTFILIRFNVKNISKIVAYFFLGSVFSIITLLYYNSQLEKASLKTISKIVTQADNEWVNSIITETLLDKDNNKIATNTLLNNSNLDKSAFQIWSKSKLQKESINSSVNFIDTNGTLLGGFGSVYPELNIKEKISVDENLDKVVIFEENILNLDPKLLRGIYPINYKDSLLGYLDVTILSDLNDFGFYSHPKFIASGKLTEKTAVSLGKILILDYQNQELKNIYGEINPSEEINQIILNTEFSERNEAWLSIHLNKNDYLIYTKKLSFDNVERVVAIALKNKELSFSLFDFFKTFFSHVIVLLLILLIYIVARLNKKRDYFFNLRTQLLLTFLIISLIPLILLAFYFRNLTEDKNNSAIYYKLGKRAFNVETYINKHANSDSLDFVFSAASNDLNINYSIYDNKKLEYSTQDLLYDVELIPNIIHPKAYNNLILNGSQEILIKDAIDKYQFNSFYYKANILGKQQIIKVSDAFNNILLPLSGTEVDVFLFGTYSLAVILIIMLSAYLANRISAPIRKLTRATKSVAGGDLSLEIKTNAQGEVKELETSFQYMLKELKRNQAILSEIEREEAWKEMAKQVAHEIKNPLTPMKLSVQQLVTAYNDKSEKFDGFFKKVTATLLNQIETLKNIATEFSNFARMPRLKVEEINCIKVIEQSVDLFTNENVSIKFDSVIKECVIDADSEQLKRTLINLIRNSIQANSTAIIIRLEEDLKKYVLTISDNGKGINPQIVDKIFEPNFTTKKDGMGLGLSLVKRYLTNTGGDILVEESNSKGTSIKLKFPKKSV
ncbi:MAG: HAMP domain-containing protein [Ignavibacteriae bacterium]|nr:HAMP domain-containing protein [Ignavibacteriota bacterium]